MRILSRYGSIVIACAALMLMLGPSSIWGENSATLAVNWATTTGVTGSFTMTFYGAYEDNHIIISGNFPYDKDAVGHYKYLGDSNFDYEFYTTGGNGERVVAWELYAGKGSRRIRLWDSCWAGAPIRCAQDVGSSVTNWQ